jgi:cleavage and polyadenylation specificity factor subunit 1
MANGLVEHFHRSLNAAIMCHADKQWTEELPLILLVIRMAFEQNLQSESVAELIYSQPLRISSELLTLTADPVDPANLITQLCLHMAYIRPVLAPCIHQAHLASDIWHFSGPQHDRLPHTLH